VAEVPEGPRLWEAAKALSLAVVEAVSGVKLPDEALEFDQLWGRRILVVREPPDKHKGLIEIPDPARTRKVTGWVIACGVEVGIPVPTDQVRPGYSPFPPEELLLKRVLFSAYAGQPVTFTVDGDHPNYAELRDFERDQTTPLLLMTDLDIMWSY